MGDDLLEGGTYAAGPQVDHARPQVNHARAKVEKLLTQLESLVEENYMSLDDMADELRDGFDGDGFVAGELRDGGFFPRATRTVLTETVFSPSSHHNVVEEDSHSKTPPGGKRNTKFPRSEKPTQNSASTKFPRSEKPSQNSAFGKTEPKIFFRQYRLIPNYEAEADNSPFARFVHLAQTILLVVLEQGIGAPAGSFAPSAGGSAGTAPAGSAADSSPGDDAKDCGAGSSSSAEESSGRGEDEEGRLVPWHGLEVSDGAGEQTLGQGYGAGRR